MAALPTSSIANDWTQASRLLRVGITGPDVTALHTALLRLGYGISASETARKFFGPTTLARVVAFQGRHHVRLETDLFLGVVDATTAALLFQELAERGDTTRYVTGRVVYADSFAGSSLRVKLYNKQLRQHKLLAKPEESDCDGYYRISYNPVEGGTPAKRTATLMITVEDAEGQVLYSPTTEQLIFAAPDLAIADLSLARNQKDKQNEYDELLGLAEALVDGQALDLAGLVQNDEQQDITFLSNETGIDGQKWTNLVIAEKLSAKYKVSRPLLYALFAENALLLAASSRTTITGMRFSIDFNTELEPLFYETVLLPQDQIERAVTKAIADNYVPASLKDHVASTMKQLSTWTDKAMAYVKNSRETRLFETIRQYLAAGKAETLQSLLATNADGDFSSLLTKLSDGIVFSSSQAQEKAKVASKLTEMLPFAPSMVAKVAELKGIDSETGIRELASLSEAQWEEILRDPKLPSSAGASDESRKSASAVLFRLIEKRYPTISFAAQLSSEDAKNGFGPHTAAIADILSRNPDFDLASGHIGQLFEGKSGTEKKSTGVAASPSSEASTGSVKQQMKVLQRVFKLAPTFRQTKALISNNIFSSLHVKAMGKSRFMRQFASKPEHPFTPAEGENVFRRAEDIHIATNILAGEIQATAAATHIKALSSQPFGLPVEKLQAVTQNFPNMTSLFQLGDACACSDCMTVFSASAYLCDVLQWLGQREVVDTRQSSPADSQSALTVLFKRRGDLGDTDLSCINTNTTLPYVDLVCELLEDAVQTEPLYTYGATLTDSKGLISAGLQTYLHGKNLPFTTTATVTNVKTDNAIVRDENIVMNFTLNGTTWQGRVLRQTYGTSEDLAAVPAYVNEGAYKVLSDANYAFSLPFDLWHEETKAYFGAFGILRSDLMRDLVTGLGAIGQSPKDIEIATEELGLTMAEERLITTDDSANQEKYWNTQSSTGHPEYVMRSVDVFVTKSGLQYADLQAIMSLGQSGAKSWVNPTNNLFIRHLDDSCDLAMKIIENLEVIDLDRLHRFIRLWLKFGKPNGWDIATLDQAIVAEKLGKDTLDGPFLVQLNALEKLRGQFDSPLTAAQCVQLYDMLPIDVDGSLYANIFLNSAANGPIEKAFLPANVHSNEDNVTNHTGTIVLLSDYKPSLATCLSVTEDDVALLIQSLPQMSNEPVTTESMSTVYQRHFLATSLQISITDFLSLKTLTEIPDLDSPLQTTLLYQKFKELQSSGVAVIDLTWWLLHEGDTIGRDLPDPATISLLTNLQSGYAAARTFNASPFIAGISGAASPPPTAAENTAPLLTLLSKLPGVTSDDLGKVRTLLTKTWAQVTLTPNAFIDQLLSKFVNITPIDVAVTALSGATSDSDIESAALSLIELLDESVSDYMYLAVKKSLLISTIASTFSFAADQASVLLEFAKVTFGATSRSISDVLLDDALITPLTPLPPLTANAFDLQFRAVRLLWMMSSFLPTLSLKTADLQWMLLNNKLLNWMALDSLRYQDDIPAVAFASWEQLYRIVALINRLKPVTNPADKDAPFTMFGLFDLVVTATTVEPVLEYLVQLIGWDSVALTALSSRFGLQVSDFRSPNTLTRLDAALSLLRRLSLDAGTAGELLKSQLVEADSITMRRALKTRYADSDWLGVLKSIQDPLRLQKRDALVAYLLAVNPSLKSADDLYDYYLIDVEMGSAMLTSRIVQAHATVQLFVQRCLMGLEPSAFADTVADTAWQEWEWMSMFQPWVANKKILIWPENWMVPSLRDDKTEIFSAFENSARQNSLDAQSLNDVVLDYMESLEQVAQLDVMALHYQTDLKIMHVFARTKGGDPVTWYYRQFIKEQSWTSWKKMNVDITGDQVVAFDRNSRVYLAWLIFTTENEPQSQMTYPNPDGTNADGSKTTQKARQRLNIKLAISEQSLNGTWGQKKLSTGPVYYPENYSDGSPNYIDTDQIPPIATITLVSWELNDIVDGGLSLFLGFPGSSYLTILGSFALTGCKGYPEPVPNSVAKYISFRPEFRNCAMAPEVSVKDVTDVSDYAIKTIFDANAGDYDSLLAETYGTFKTTIAMEMSLIDWWIFAMQFFGTTRKTETGTVLVSRQFNVPLATFMPFFHADPSRTWVVVPELGLGERKENSSTKTTLSDIYPIFVAAFALVQKHLKTWVPATDYQTWLNEVLSDPEFTNLQNFWPAFGKLWRYQFKNFYHPLMCFLIKTVNRNGIPALMSRATQLYENPFDFNETYGPTPLVVVDYPKESLSFEPDDAYAQYNWELFFHMPFEIATMLSQDQQFSEARTWFHYIFNPEGGSDTQEVPKRYWNTKPFFDRFPSDYLNQRIDHLLEEPATTLDKDLSTAVDDWRRNPYSPYVIGRSRTVAFQVALVLAYIQNLLDWGDNLFRQFTRETVTQATQMYVLADKLLGPKPRNVPRAVPVPINTFNELESRMDLLGNALLELENLVPDLSTLPHQGEELAPGTSDPNLPPPPAVAPFGAVFTALYFAIPQNENMLQYWTTVADRLFKIRNSQNIDGVAASLALFSPPIDPGALVRAYASGASISSILQGLSAPTPVYRFSFTLQKATELISRTSQLGSSLLQAIERKDSEALSRLRNSQELLVLNSVRLVKSAAIDEANSTLKSLAASLAVTTERQTYYSTQEFMNTWEEVALGLNAANALVQAGAGIALGFAGAAKLVPEFSVGVSGFGGSPSATFSYGGNKVGGAAETIANALSTAGRVIEIGATAAGQQGSFHRRSDEWSFNATLAGLDSAVINAQMATAELHLTMLQKDLDAHDAAIKESQLTNDFMQSKFTNQELYEWMQSQLFSAYSIAYQTGLEMAQRAEKCFAFELVDNSTFLTNGYWDSLKSGLLAAESLLNDVKQMESAYLARNVREYELSKSISFAELDPYALIALRSTGKCLIQIPEAVFDMDHPGHYLRRNRSVAISIPCIVGPYVSVSAKLSLISNRYRKNNNLASGTSPYAELPVGGDVRFTYNVGMIQSIATSTCVNDSGVFELSFRDERFLPFEGTGAIALWQLELPTVIQRFDYNTITDVILQLKYTARDGGSTLRGGVENEQLKALTQIIVDAGHTGLYQAFRFKQQFPNEWWTLLQTNTVTLTVGPQHLPYFTQNQGPKIQSVQWFAQVQSNPNSTVLSLNGADVNLNSNNLNSSKPLTNLLMGTSAPNAVVLGTPMTVAWTDENALLDLTMLVSYTLKGPVP